MSDSSKYLFASIYGFIDLSSQQRIV